MILCPSCKKEQATIDSIYGVLNCTNCQERVNTLPIPHTTHEFTTADIKEQRKAYLSDLLPMHNRGQLSKEWLDKYGPKKAKERGFDDQEIKTAKNVWHESYYEE